MAHHQEAQNILNSARSIVGTDDMTDISNRIGIMRHQEDTAYKCIDYLHQLNKFNMNNSSGNNDNTLDKQKIVNEECRLKMIQWCLQVATFCKFDHETVTIGISFLDRFLSSNITTSRTSCLHDRKEFQLASMCAFYIAVKLNEQRELDISLLSDISHGVYTTDRISRMEEEMLRVLEWRMNPPTALAFLQHFMAIMMISLSSSSAAAAAVITPVVKDAMFNLARRQTDLAMTDYYFVTCRPSIMAVASLMNAMECLERDKLFHLSEGDQRAFFCEMSRVAGVKVTTNPEVRNVRERLKRVMKCYNRHLMSSDATATKVTGASGSTRPGSPVNVVGC